MQAEDNIGGDDKLADHLTQLPEWTLEGKWKKVVKTYEKCREGHATDIKKSRYMGTALHVAIKFNKEDVVTSLVDAIIEHGERGPNDIHLTPLFVAARNGSKAAFGYLRNISGDNVVPTRDLALNDGNSILHLAIRKGVFDLAIIIVDCYPSLAIYANEKDGSTPLKVLATSPLAFREVEAYIAPLI